MTGPSAKAEQALRRNVIRNDQQSKLHPDEHEPSTMFAMANLNVDTSVSSGRVGKDYVAGSELHVSYPAASGPWADPVRVPDEPSLGYSVNDLAPTGEVFEVNAGLSAAAVGRAEVAAPTLVDHPTANVVERASATSSISSASASPAGDGDGVGHNHSIVRTPSPTLRRPVRRL
jgi:hypothetical protein